MSGDLGQRKTSTVAEPVPAASATAAASSSNQQPKETKTMADSQHQTPQKPDFQKLIQLVHSADIQAGNESASALREMLLNGEATLLCGLLSQYVQTESEKLLEIIAAVRHPLDKVLLDQLTEIWRFHPHACLSLVSHLILKQVPWLYRFPQHPSFKHFLTTMTTRRGSTRSTADDISYYIYGSLVLASLVLSAAPVISSNLSDIFNAFLFLAGILQENTPSPSEETPQLRISLLHFRLALYALFQRLYGLFPCHFLTFLRQNFAGPQTTAKNKVLYQEIVRPMLDIVKLHPLLVTANKDGELANERWVRKEVHDILAECNRVAGDPYENCIAEDNTASMYFQRGLVRPPSNSNFLSWTSSFASRPSSSSFSNKPTPIKDGSSTTPSVTPKAPYMGRVDGMEKRQLALAPILLPAASSSTHQKSASGVGQQQTTFWSPSDAVGLSTPPEEAAEEGRSTIPELRLKPAPDRNRTTLQAVGRKTSMAAGPESPAPHMRSFRTGSWGADARQKFLQNRQKQQQEHLKQQQSSAAGLLEPERKTSMARRSFGQAFAKLFQRPVSASTSSASLPQSPSARRPQSDSSFEFGFEPTEFRPTTSVRQYRDSSLSQQAELAEEADEACASSAAGSAATSRNGAGSLVTSKRPSLSEPVLFPQQLVPATHPSAEEIKEASEPVDQNGNGVTFRNLSTVLKTLAKENDGNLLEESEIQRYWSEGTRQYTAQIKKQSSFSSSRTSSSVAVITSGSGDRTRHSSSATATSGAGIQHDGLSRHSSLLDTQAVAGNNRASMTPPVGETSDSGVTCGNSGHPSGDQAADFQLGAPDDNEEDEELMKLRASTNITESSDSAVDDGSSLPRLSTSHSLADFISRMNRIRFDSRCVVGEEPPDSTSEQSVAGTAENPTIIAAQPHVVAAASALPPEFRPRGSTFSGVMPRPVSCPPGATAATGTVRGRKKQGNAMDRSVLSDEAVEKDAEIEEARPYDALLLLTRQQAIAPPAIPIRPSPYQLLDDYITAASATHSGDRSWPEMKEESSVGSGFDKASQSPDLHNARKVSSMQRKTSAMQQHSGRDGHKDTLASLKSEIQDLQAQLVLWKQRVFYERHQRLLHAERNRRLFGRLKQATTLDEQNQAQRDQLRLQETEIHELMTALTELRRQNASQKEEFSGKEFQLTSRLQAMQRESETTKSQLMASKRTSDELLVENSRLRKELGGFVQKLFDKEAAYAQLHDQCAQELPSSKHSIAQLNKELFLMGEMNRRLRERVKTMKLRQEEFDALRERLRSCEETYKQETSNYRRLARKERHKADAATQRIQELEAVLQRRQAQIAESKRRLDQASDVHQEQLAACQMKYTALMTACQRQEAHILELYEKLEAQHIAQERRKSGIRLVEGAGVLSAENRSNGGMIDEDGEDAADGPPGLDIPVRTGTASEIRSYDSYHSASYMSQHQVGGPNALSTSVGSCQSTDLYLPYLFNLEFQSAQRRHDGEIEDSGDDHVDDGEDDGE